MAGFPVRVYNHLDSKSSLFQSSVIPRYFTSQILKFLGLRCLGSPVGPTGPGLSGETAGGAKGPGGGQGGAWERPR